MFKLLGLGLALLVLSGCASYGVIHNKPAGAVESQQAYSIKQLSGRRGSGDIALMLAFSGGGTRAAALAYGVLQELRDTTLVIDGQPRRLLDEVDTISSVSGGSFTSAYYGLYGDRLFADFEEVFLRRDVQGTLIHSLFNPLGWFRSTGRTETAVKYYEEVVFQDATFADMGRSGGPLVLINASDLGYGVRFSFVQEYFNLLCSDISSFPVARAVTASSAVPVVFNPVVVENYQECKQTLPGWLTEAQQRVEGDPQLTEVVDGLKSYFKKENRQYAHFVDGGITDNLGLRAIYEVIEVAGGAKVFVEKRGRKPPRQMVVISVNASTEVEPEMDKSNKQPSLRGNHRCGDRHSTAPLQCSDPEPDEQQPETLGAGVVDPGHAGYTPFHSGCLCRRPATRATRVFQSYPHQLRPHRRTGGQADRRRSRAVAQQPGLPALADGTGTLEKRGRRYLRPLDAGIGTIGANWPAPRKVFGEYLQQRENLK